MFAESFEYGLNVAFKTRSGTRARKAVLDFLPPLSNHALCNGYSRRAAAMPLVVPPPSFCEPHTMGVSTGLKVETSTIEGLHRKLVNEATTLPEKYRVLFSLRHVPGELAHNALLDGECCIEECDDWMGRGVVMDGRRRMHALVSGSTAALLLD